MLYLVFIDLKQDLGEDPPRDVFRAAAVLPAWDPARGSIEGIELLKLLTRYVLKTCAPVRGP